MNEGCFKTQITGQKANPGQTKRLLFQLIIFWQIRNGVDAIRPIWKPVELRGQFN